jgi:colanic acid biosynthesis glycosyl transferase WcaI
LRILIVSQYFWPENFRINDLALALKEKGHAVTVLTGMPNYPAGRVYDGYGWWSKRQDVMQGIPIFRVPLFVRRKSKSWHLILNYLSFMFSACILGPRLLWKQKFDIVFIAQYSPVTVAIPAILISSLKSAGLIMWVQDLWPDSLSAAGAIRSEKILSIVGYVVKWIYHKCDRILVQSKGFIEPAVKVGAEREKVSYFPNWAEALYQPMVLEPSARECTELPSTGFVVMFAGNFGVAQSLDTIVKAAELLRDKNIHWVLLGDGRRRSWLDSEVQSKCLKNVHVLGGRPMETMPRYFSLADAMLVTLKDDPVMTATIPGKVQSYLACGKPIIGALNGSGAAVISDSRAGYCVPSDDYQGLANSVLKMSELSAAELQEMGECSLSYYRNNFDRDMLVSQLDGCMHEMLGIKSDDLQTKC